MNLNFYGTRGVFPTSEQMVSLVLETSTDMLLIDAGSFTIFHNDRIIEETSSILISHNHHDHIALLPHFVLARFHRSKSIGKDLPNCKVVSPEPLTFLMNSMGLEEDTDYEYYNYIPDNFADPNLSIALIQTKHPVINYGYKISDGQRNLVYTGDTGYFSDLIEFCHKTDLVICEASYSDKNREKAEKWGHMTPAMVAKLINEADLSNVILTHFVELGPKEFVSQVKNQIKQSTNVIAAYTGMEISI